jgi:hypothetical protein
MKIRFRNLLPSVNTFRDMCSNARRSSQEVSIIFRFMQNLGSVEKVSKISHFQVL